MFYSTVSNILLLYVLLSFVIGMDGAESLYGGGGERDPRRATHILHPLHMSNAPLENTKARRKHRNDAFVHSCLKNIHFVWLQLIVLLL